MQSNSNVGGGSFLAYEDSGRMFYHSLPACAFFFFLERERLSRAHYFHSFMPGSVHSGLASYDDILIN